MNFKNRYLIEEASFGDTSNKVTNFIKENPKLSAAGAGLAAGLVHNYLGDGADETHKENEAVLNNFNKGIGDGVAAGTEGTPISKEEFIKANKLWNDAADTGTTNGWFKDRLGFLPGVNNDSQAMSQYKAMSVTNPIIASGAKPQDWDNLDSTFGNSSTEVLDSNLGSVSGYKFDPQLSPDSNWEAFKNSLPEDQKSMNSQTVQQYLEDHPELVREKANLENNLSHSTRDSYLKSAALGTALGLGGAFAARKAQESMNKRG